MEKFITKIAKHLINNHSEELNNVIIVFQNKRAGLFLKKELSKLIEKPIWSPEILSIQNFFNKFSGLRVADNIELLFYLHIAYNKVIPDTKFEDFIPWGNTLLNDFNDIDNYLANSQQVYSLIEDFNKIETLFGLDFSDDNTKTYYENYVNFWEITFNQKMDKYKLKQVFIEIWRHLYEIYENYKQILLEKKIAYQGLEARLLAEDINYIDAIRKGGVKHIYFCGFNALSNSEAKIIKDLEKEGIAHVYIDVDEWYIKDNMNEAGHFIRKHFNINLKDNSKSTPWISDVLAKSKKKFNIIGSTSDIGQCISLQTELLELISKNELDVEDTAIITTNDNLVLPLLNSLPPQIEDINITMGFPFKSSMTYSFIEAIIKLQLSVKQDANIGKYSFNYREVIKILLHPFFSNYKKENQKIIKVIVDKNLIYIDNKFIESHIKNTLLKNIFQSVSEDNELSAKIKIFEYLEKIILNVFKVNTQSQENTTKQFETYMKFENEFLYASYKTIKKTQNLFESHNEYNSPSTILKIIKQLLNNISIPFEGEPLKGIQVMGFLETRSLDFKNIFILSANENILPPQKHNNSYIPYNIRKTFELPAKEDEEAIYAYNFYRLLQNAQNINIIYNNSPKDDSNGEKSRYIYQIKYELAPEIAKYNNYPLSEVYQEIVYNNNISFANNNDINIEKNDSVYNLLVNQFATTQHSLSATSLYSYSKCPLQFYFKYLLRLELPDEVQEETDAKDLGNILHKCMEKLYDPFKDKDISIQDIGTLKQNIDTELKKAFFDILNIDIEEELKGRNILLFDLLKKTADNFIQFDKIKVQKSGLKIIGLETKYTTSIEIENYDNPIGITGYFDRIDLTGNTHSIIDYKTGNVDNNQFKIDTETKDVEDIFSKTSKKEVFQTIVYAILFLHNNPNANVNINIYSMRNLNQALVLNKNETTSIKSQSPVIATFEEKLKNMINEIFDKNISFCQTNDTDNCLFCDFKDICKKS